MKIFLIDHLDGCSPLDPCASCEAARFIRDKLSDADLQHIVALAKRGSVSHRRAADDEPVTILEGLSRPLSKAIHNNDCRTIGAICRLSEGEWLLVPKIGQVLVTELQASLWRFGRQLGDLNKAHNIK